MCEIGKTMFNYFVLCQKITFSFSAGNWWNSPRCYEGTKITVESLLATHNISSGNITGSVPLLLQNTTTPVEEYWQ